MQRAWLWMNIYSKLSTDFSMSTFGIRKKSDSVCHTDNGYRNWKLWCEVLQDSLSKWSLKQHALMKLVLCVPLLTCRSKQLIMSFTLKTNRMYCIFKYVCYQHVVIRTYSMITFFQYAIRTPSNLEFQLSLVDRGQVFSKTVSHPVYVWSYWCRGGRPLKSTCIGRIRRGASKPISPGRAAGIPEWGCCISCGYKEKCLGRQKERGKGEVDGEGWVNQGVLEIVLSVESGKMWEWEHVVDSGMWWS